MTTTLPTTATTPTGLLGGLADLLAAHHADSLLAALLTVLQPHLATTGPAATTRPVYIDLTLVIQVHLLLERCAALHLLPAILAETGAFLTPPSPPTRRRPVTDVGLTGREHAVLLGIANGDTNHHIAHQLDISVDTVKTHVSKLFKKLDARDRAHAVTIGHRLGYLNGAHRTTVAA